MLSWIYLEMAMLFYTSNVKNLWLVD